MQSQEDRFAHLFVQDRFQSNQFPIGSLFIGGDSPVIVQSMTNTNTLDTKATVEQCIRIFDAGAQMVRIATQGIAEAENLKNIKAELLTKGYSSPLVADVHFLPNAAEIAAKYVEKVRINPGNYAEKTPQSDYSPMEYQQALDRIAQKLKPLIQICKENETAIRIGVNHGALSNRILSRYGNTPEGMVESALEFIRVFEDAQFYNLVVSLKSSHVQSMVYANRLLAARMKENNHLYPIHLGVTEAGNGLAGRQKSIGGIASLLNDGIGDTIRVSLTEAPENEIPLAKNLIEYFQKNKSKYTETLFKPWFNPTEYQKRKSNTVLNIGGKNQAVVVLGIGYKSSCSMQKPYPDFLAPNEDIAYLGNERPIFFQEDKVYIQNYSVWKNEQSNCFPLLSFREWESVSLANEQIVFVQLNLAELQLSETIKRLKNSNSLVLILEAISDNPIAEWRTAFWRLHENEVDLPVVLHRKFEAHQNDQFLLESTALFSSLLLDGFGDGIWLQDLGCVHRETTKQIAFGLLQSCRLRQSQTEYIACPSCARMLFDIEKRLEEVREKTKPFKHLKIAVMGCVVNGLDEMADADYGYVGSVPGKVNLYKGNLLMGKNINEENASDMLVALIKKEGDWQIQKHKKSPV
jgi:(E)-4-hydroxy-3-methylbut-2-enyl-diphosphate synthase